VSKVSGCRAPAVYLTWANRVFLAFFPFNGISKLRVFSVAFSPIPTAAQSLAMAFKLARKGRKSVGRQRVLSNGLARKTSNG
jgi:hypothetical protein